MLPLELDKKQKFNGSKKLFPSNKESKTKMTNLICKRLSKASCNVMHAKGDPYVIIRGGSRAAAASKMEHFMIIVNGFQLLTIITKRSSLDVAAVLDPPLVTRSILETKFRTLKVSEIFFPQTVFIPAMCCVG